MEFHPGKTGDFVGAHELINAGCACLFLIGSLVKLPKKGRPMIQPLTSDVQQRVARISKGLS